MDFKYFPLTSPLFLFSQDDQELRNKKERSRSRSGRRHRRLSSKSKRHSLSSEEMDVDTDCSSLAQTEKETATVAEQEGERVSKMEKEEKDNGSRISNLTDSPVSTSNVNKKEKNITPRIRQSYGEKEGKSISDTLKESLADYCVRVMKCCPDLDAVLTVVNECHVNEVELFFQAVRVQEPALVGQLQEQILDSGTHNRLVTILSDMYA